MTGFRPIRPIRTDEDHAAALKEVERLWGADIGTPEGDYLDVLVTLVEAYEEKRWPMGDSDPVDIIKFAIDEMGHSQKELADLLGSRSRASEILNRKRPLTMKVAHKLHKEWHIPAAVLLQSYRLEAD
jgi:HTH-type transcriptional regulator/antitoxin HigA